MWCDLMMMMMIIEMNILSTSVNVNNLVLDTIWICCKNKIKQNSRGQSFFFTCICTGGVGSCVYSESFHICFSSQSIHLISLQYFVNFINSDNIVLTKEHKLLFVKAISHVVLLI